MTFYLPDGILFMVDELSTTEQRPVILNHLLQQAG
nr:MAG TPA: hypothetical protein [Caudoviricetes sp.]